MGWANINLNLMEAIDFSIKTHSLILPVFDHATNALYEEWKKFEETFNKQISEAYARDESEGALMAQEKDWEEELHRQRLQSVGALSLDWLMSSVQAALHSAKNYLNKSHPPHPPYDSHDEGWLGLVADEYQKRFGIDFKAGPVDFERIRELVFARNAGIHRENDGNLKTYLAKIKHPVFFDSMHGGPYFFVKRDALVGMINDAERFIKWVVQQVENLRPH